MFILIAGLAVFIGIHLLPSIVPLRQALIGKMGEQSYQGLFALVSAIGFGLIIYGMILSAAAPQLLWTPPEWGRKLTIPLMLLAMVLLASPHMKTNLKRITNHPMLWGVLLWAVAHSLVNNEAHTILLFASFGIFALVAMLSATLRGTRKQQDKYPLKNDIIVIVAGIVAYGAFLGLHPYLFGVAVI